MNGLMRNTVGLLALVFFAASANVGLAQYGRPGYPYPVYPNSNRYGNALYGQADVNRSYGDTLQGVEQARILREKSNQAKLDTKKKAFDEMLYEKANTPSYVETLDQEKAQVLARTMNHPLRGEITNGKTLNVMLPYLQSLSTHGTLGPPVVLSQSIVNQLNISTSGSSSVGMLRAGGQVEWPIGLRGEHQKNLDKLLPAAVNATANGTLEPAQLKQVRTEMKAMRERLAKQCANDEIETKTYLNAVEFYNTLLASVDALERPDARKQLAGSMSPRARNVQELVDYMTDNGVRFAPSSPGNEAAYQVAHDAFVRYIRTSQSSSGMVSMNSPVAMPPGKRK